MPEFPVLHDLPEIPAQDFIFGFISAGILLWAALYVTRSRAVERILSGATRGAAREMFSYAAPAGASGHLSFLGSMFLHLFLVSLIPWLQFIYPDAIPFDMSRYDLVILRFQAREAPLYLPADLAWLDRAPNRNRPPRAVDLPMRELRAQPAEENDPGVGDLRDVPKTETDPGGEGAPKPPLQRVVIEIVLPEGPPPTPALAALAQPEVAVELPAFPSDSLASEIAWTFTTPDLADIPNPGMPALAELDLERPPELAVEAGLPGALPYNLIPARGLTPALSDIAGPAELGPDGYGSLLASNGDRADSAALLLAQALSNGPLAQLFGWGLGAGSGGGGGREGDGFGAGAGSGASGEGRADGLGRGFGGRSPVPRRFHGIIVISNQATSIPEAAGVLTGAPIYTVYLRVPNSRRKWVFQVCIPSNNSGSVEIEGGVVRVISRKRLDPPYAFRKIPLALSREFEDVNVLPERVVVYATLDEEGELGNLRIISGADPETDNMILANLEEWEFAPAYRNGRPVAVEALFGIPLW